MIPRRPVCQMLPADQEMCIRDSLYFHLLAQFFDDFDDVPTQRLVNYFPPVLRRKYQVIFAPIAGMCRMLYLIFHLPKTSFALSWCSCQTISIVARRLYLPWLFYLPLVPTRGFVKPKGNKNREAASHSPPLCFGEKKDVLILCTRRKGGKLSLIHI